MSLHVTFKSLVRLTLSGYALFACFKLVQLLSSFIVQAILATFTLAPSVAQVSIPS